MLVDAVAGMVFALRYDFEVLFTDFSMQWIFIVASVLGWWSRSCSFQYRHWYFPHVHVLHPLNLSVFGPAGAAHCWTRRELKFITATSLEQGH